MGDRTSCQISLKKNNCNNSWSWEETDIAPRVEGRDVGMNQGSVPLRHWLCLFFACLSSALSACQQRWLLIAANTHPPPLQPQWKDDFSHPQAHPRSVSVSREVEYCGDQARIDCSVLWAEGEDAECIGQPKIMLIMVHFRCCWPREKAVRVEH